MNNRTLLFAAIAVAFVFAFAFVASPYSSLNLADAFQYGGGGFEASVQGAPLIVGAGDQLGDAAAADVAGDGIRRNITGCPLRDAPGGNILPFTFAGEAPSAGYSSDFGSVLFNIGAGNGAWVDLADCPQAS